MTARFWNITYLAILAALALTVAYTFSRYSYEIQGGVLVFIGLCLLSFWMLRKMAQAEEGQWFLAVLVAAFFIKLLAAIVRYNTNELFYNGQYDAERYHNTGIRVAQDLWKLDFSFITSLLKLDGAWGTRYTEFYSGIVHAFAGPSIFAAFFIFSALSFIGLYFYYRAFCIAFPSGNRKLYALLIFLMPSLVFWPNILGKDALMAFFLGLTAYGVARVFAGEYGKCIIPMCIGAAGSFTIRPHMTAIMLISMVAALLLGGGKFLSRSPILYIAVVATILTIGWYFVPVAMEYTGLAGGSVDDLQQYIDRRQSSTSGGGSGFTFPSITNPLNFPEIAMTIIFRPFPWEAHNLQAFIQATDGALLLGLVLWKIRRVLQALGSITSKPYVSFILVYTMLFVVAFTTVANFGTLARERAMLLPFLLMLVAFLPDPRPSRQEALADTRRPVVANHVLARPQTI